jgi:TolB-like protein/tetratricopeptide (TPR) repeat protein
MAPPSLLQRLKERKLVQWGAAYLLFSAGFLGVMDAVSDPLLLSVAIQRVIIVFLIFGFFLTLLFAWHHGERGVQKVSGREAFFAGALLGLACLIAVAVHSVAYENGEASPGPSTHLPDDVRPSIAVLPFDNFSPSPDDAYFADGMQEQLVLTLSKIRSLSVKGRTSAMRYRDNPKPIPEIAEELGVAFVLEGSARIAGGRVSVTAQLVDAIEDEHLWSEEYDRQFSVDAIVSIHREIAGQVASQLRAVLTPEERTKVGATPTANTVAFEHYLRGREAWRRRSAGDLRTAITHFSAALEEDEGFAQAHSGLADVLLILAWTFQDTALFRRAGESAERAVSHDGLLAEAHTSMAYVRFVWEWDWAGAEESFRRALDLDPNNGTAHQWYGELLGTVGRFEDGIRETGLAVEMDPLSPGANLDHGEALLYAGRIPEGIHFLERARDLEPAFWGPYVHLVHAYALVGREAEALQTLKGYVQQFVPPQDLSEWEEVWELEDFHGVLNRILEGLEKLTVRGLRYPGGFGFLARLYLLGGRPTEALRCLETALITREPFFMALMGDPVYDTLRDDQRFHAILRQLALSP